MLATAAPLALAVYSADAVFFLWAVAYILLPNRGGFSVRIKPGEIMVLNQYARFITDVPCRKIRKDSIFAEYSGKNHINRWVFPKLSHYEPCRYHLPWLTTRFLAEN